MSTRREPLYRALSSLVSARLNCIARKPTANVEWQSKHEDSIAELVEFLPSGSGIDGGTKIDLDASTPEKLVFTFGFHHMNDAGMYDGWTEHTLTVRPSLQFDIATTISGRNRNDIKDYLYETYGYALTQDVWQDATEPYAWHYAPYEQTAAV